MAGKPQVGDGRRGNLNIRALDSEIESWKEAAWKSRKTLSAWARDVLSAASGHKNPPAKKPAKGKP